MTTDNRRTQQPSEKLTPPVKSNTPPVTTPAATRPAPEPITAQTIQKNLNAVAVLIQHPDRIDQDKDHAFEVFSNLTLYSVGDQRFHPIYKKAVHDLAQGSSNAGHDIVERLAKITAAKNNMTTDVLMTGTFGADKQQFDKNYNIVSVILDNALDKSRQLRHETYQNSVDNMVTNTMKTLVNGHIPVVTHLTPDDKKQYLTAIPA